MVQYPRNEPVAAKPGKFHGGMDLDCRREFENKCDQQHDFLATVSSEHGSDLCGLNAIDILNDLKGAPEEKRKKKKSERIRILGNCLILDLAALSLLPGDYHNDALCTFLQVVQSKLQAPTDCSQS
jgi:hypothetical protein